MASNGKISVGKLIEKDLEGNVRCMIEVLYWNLPGETDDPDRKGYHGPPGWGLDIGFTTPLRIKP
jgi:hypothetical protein